MVIALALLAVAALILLRGLVLTYLWLWFVTPFGVPALSLAHAVGISLLVGLFLAKRRSHTEEESQRAVGFVLTSTLMIWALGYIVHQFMV